MAKRKKQPSERQLQAEILKGLNEKAKTKRGKQTPKGRHRSTPSDVRRGQTAPLKTKAGKPKAEKFTLPEGIKKDSYRKIRSRFTEKGKVRLRGKNGHYLTLEAQAAILHFAKKLDKEKIPYTYEMLLSIPEIENKIIVFKDETPREIFYWNLLSIIDIEKASRKKSRDLFDENTRKYTVIGFRGKTTVTTSRSTATELVFRYCKKLDKATEQIREETKTDPYFRVDVYFTENSDEDILAIKMDFRDVKGNVPKNIINKYLYIWKYDKDA